MGEPSASPPPRVTAIITLRRAGMPYSDIADVLDLGISRQRVAQIWQANASDEDFAVAADAVFVRDRDISEGRARRLRESRARRELRSWMARERIIEAIHEWHELFGEPPGARDWNSAQRGCLPALDTRYASTGRKWPEASNVQRRFGSWNAAIAAAGLTPRPRGKHGPRVRG